MKKLYLILVWVIWILFYTNSSIVNASSVCQTEYNRINELKIELANLQEQYVWGKIEKEINEKYPWGPYNSALINAKYQEWADKEALLIVQINKQITIYEVCLNNAKETIKVGLDNAETDLTNAKDSFIQNCQKMNAVANSSYTNCECVLWTSYNSSVWKCTSDTPSSKCYDLVNGYLWTDGSCYCKLWYSWDDTSKKCKDNGTISVKLKNKAKLQFDKYKKQYSRLTKESQKYKYETLLAGFQKKAKNLKWDNLTVNNLIIELIKSEISKL